MHEILSQESEIFARVIAPSEGSLPKPAAESLVSLSFPGHDVDRMNELAEKKRKGEATQADRDEMEGYSRRLTKCEWQ